MIKSLALIFLVGYTASVIFKKIKLPSIIGMLFTGIILGPYVLNFLDPQILDISAELRKIALIIILIKAGLSLDISSLKRVGRPAVLLSFLPALAEIIAVLIFAPRFLGVTIREAAIIGAVLGAVSPAVVVPRMVKLIEERYGTDKSIPQLILAGASLDDVFVIVLFSSFISIEQGNSVDFSEFLNIPVSIITGIISGILAGFILSFVFEFSHKKGISIRQSAKTIIILGVSFLLITLETILENKLALSGLLSVMAMACTVKMRCREEVSTDLSEKFGKLWVAAEIVLFVLVGAAVDIRYTLEAGISTALLLLISLTFRSIGVLICLIKTPLNIREKIYCIFSYLPKATVQAAIGSVPLSLGLACGKTVLSVAVLSILVTAPLGAFSMDISYKKLLKNE